MSQLQESNGSISAELQEKVLIGGDLSKLSPEERMSYLSHLCKSLGLNPLSRPFEYMSLNGKLTLYTRKDATEQLRKINKISIDKMEEEIIGEIYKVKAYAIDSEGRRDVATGAVNISGAKGDGLANAIMKAETKAKRRVTLSISGLGFLDESELDTIQNISNKNPAKEKDSEKVTLLSESIIESETIECLKSSFQEAINYARSLKDKELENIFVSYKDNRKDELKLIASQTKPGEM